MVPSSSIRAPTMGCKLFLATDELMKADKCPNSLFQPVSGWFIGVRVDGFVPVETTNRKGKEYQTSQAHKSNKKCVFHLSPFNAILVSPHATLTEPPTK